MHARFLFRRAVLVAAMATIAVPALAQTPPASAPTTAPAPVTAMASVEPLWSADLYPRAAGYVAEVKADIGDRVTKGQLLATIEAPELERDLAAAEAALAARRAAATAAEAAVRQAESAVAVARAQVAGIRAEVELAEVTFKRQQQLFDTKAITDQQLDDARAKTAVTRANGEVAAARIAAAEADLAAAQANAAVAKSQTDVAAAEVEKAKTHLSFTRITAPFDGTVARRLASPGDLVQASGTMRSPLFTCQRTDTVRVMCDVPEGNSGAVREGTPAEITFLGLPGKTVRGAVTRVAGALNPTSRTMRVEIDLPNADGALRPGMFAQVSLFPGAAPAAAAR